MLVEGVMRDKLFCKTCFGAIEGMGIRGLGVACISVPYSHGHMRSAYKYEFGKN